MTRDTFWILVFCLPTVAVLTVIILQPVPVSTSVSSLKGIWNSCKATICGSDSGNILCKKSHILITNVTSAQTGTFDALLFSHIRRRCMGRSNCDPASIACYLKSREEVNVDYACVEDELLEKDCWSNGKILYNNKGFIQSPNYPVETENMTLCKWRLTVPSGYYLKVILHEIGPTEYTSCGGGLRFTTDTKCPGKDIPVSYVCNEKGVDATLTTCGHTEIVMYSSVNLRFWISYLILPLQDIEPELIYDVDKYCVVHHRPDPTPVPHIGIISSTPVFLGTYTNSVSALTVVTPPDRFDENNSDQPSNRTLSTTVLSGTAVNPASSLCVPMYAIAVIIGAVGFIHLIGCLIWGQRRKIRITKAEQHIPQDDCDPDLYLTPISLEPPLSLPTCQERKTGHSNIAQNKTLDQSIRSIDMAQMPSKDGYDVVDISNNDHPQISPELEEIIYESTENCNTPYSDISGYLTVLAGSETTV